MASETQQYKVRASDGGVYTFNGPMGLSPDQQRSLIDRHLTSAPQEKSFMRQFAEKGIPKPWDVTRDYLTPAIKRPLEGVVGEDIADIASKLIVPQSAAEFMLPMGGTAVGGMVSKGLMKGRKVLGPVVGGMAAGASSGAAGEFVEGKDPVQGGFVGGLMGGVGGLAGEGISKFRRSTASGARKAANEDLTDIVSAMKERTSYTDPRTGEVTNPLDLQLLDTTDPRRLMVFAREGGSVDSMRSFLRDRLGELDQTVGRIGLPLIGRNLPPSKVWDILSEWGRKGYAGIQETITTRTGEKIGLRQAWERGMDEFAQELFRKDKSGLGPAIADEARRVYKAGMEYSRRLADPKNWTVRGENANLDTMRFQGDVNKDLGKLVKVDKEGNIAGGRLATPGREMTRVERVPTDTPPALREKPMDTSVGRETSRIFVGGTAATPDATATIQNPRRALTEGRGSQLRPPSRDPQAGRPPEYPEPGPGPRRFEGESGEGLIGATPMQEALGGTQSLRQPPQVRGTTENPSGSPTRFHMERREPEIVGWAEKEGGKETMHQAARVPYTERGPEIPPDVTLRVPQEPHAYTQEFTTGPLARRSARSSETSAVPPLNAPPSSWDVRTYSRKPTNDFEALEESLFRGAGAGTQDYDRRQYNLPPWSFRNLLYGALSTIGLPNASRVYVGQTPRLISPLVQDAINYSAIKSVPLLREPE